LVQNFEHLFGQKGKGPTLPKSFKNVDIPQLVQELEVKLAKGKVECMICYDVVEGICLYGLVQIVFQIFSCFAPS
jgi:hypothetical protein